mmetsp:Transcript_50549/g.99452  ORF Transcript_50549/g.99452 Transcript_50549/m.99452 type:complete len:701 (-) Transcript_50549:954-3056(-)
MFLSFLTIWIFFSSLSFPLLCALSFTSFLLSLSALRPLLFDGSLSCSETSHGNSERTARDVVETQPVKELYSPGLASVLSADSALDPGAALVAPLHCDLDKLPDTCLVDGLEGVEIEDLFHLPVCELNTLSVDGKERVGVVSGHSESALCEIVGAEREVLSTLGQLLCLEGASGHFNHCADLVRHLGSHLLEDSLGCLLDQSLLVVQFLLVTDQWNHHLREHLNALLLGLHCCLEDGLDLHFCEVGVADTETAPSVSQHRVGLSERICDCLQFVSGDAHLCPELLELSLRVGQELMQRGVQETDVDGKSVHDLEDRLEVCLLEGEQLRDSLSAVLLCGAEEHLSDFKESLLLHEHVLRPNEADALSSECTSDLGVVRGVGVGSHIQSSVFVRQVHQSCVLLVGLGLLWGHRLVHQNLKDLRGSCPKGIDEDLACGAVDRDRVACLQGLSCNLCSSSLLIEGDLCAPAHAGLPKASGNNGSVRGGASSLSQNALSSHHSCEVLRARLLSQEDTLDSLLCEFNGLLGGHRNHTRGSSGTCVESSSDQFAFLLGLSLVRIGKDGEEQLCELRRFHPHQCLLFVDETLLQHIVSDLDGSHSSPLACPRLEHEETAFVDSELNILHVLEVSLECLSDFLQLIVHRGHHLLQRGEGGSCLFGLCLVHWLGRSDACHNVLSLGIQEELSVEPPLSSSGITSEADACS